MHRPVRQYRRSRRRGRPRRSPGTGQGRALAGAAHGGFGAWAAPGLIYVNRDDAALILGARFGAGWTFNLANPGAWLLISAIAGVPAGLVIIAVLTR